MLGGGIWVGFERGGGLDWRGGKDLCWEMGLELGVGGIRA